jgi:uncharacterized protein YoxC
MELILYFSIALIAVAFTILIINLVKTLRSLQQTLVNVAKTMESLEKQLDGVTSETTNLLHKTNKLADDVQRKSEALHSVFEGVEGIGNTLKQTNASFETISNKVTKGALRQSEQITQVLQWGNAAIDLWEKWKIKKEQLPKKVGD